MEWRNFRSEVVPFTGLLSAECANVLLNVLFKAAVLKGMSSYVFIVYSYAIATVVLFIPFLFFSRKTVLPSPIAPFIYRICLLILISVVALVIGYKGIAYSSPTLASAMSNLIPAFTFIFAVIFRMEKIDPRSSNSWAKIVGTIVSISGALMVVLYKGPILFSSKSSTPTTPLGSPLDSANLDWVIGGLLLTAEYTLFAICCVLQGQIMRMYPSELAVSFLFTLGVTILSAPVGYVAINDLDAWRLRADISLIAILYSGIVGSCYCTVIRSWAMRLKGPVYVAMFTPLSIAVAAIMGVIFLSDAFHLGCAVGAVVISVGFYTVLWGKANEEETNNININIDDGLHGPSSFAKVPLLKASVQDV